MMTESTDEAEQQPPDEVSTEQNEQIRRERLDPDNRPEGTEVDNTQRTFDAAAGMFTDNPAYSDADRPYADEEPESQDSADTDDDQNGAQHRG